jgi:hypothetical protein
MTTAKWIAAIFTLIGACFLAGAAALGYSTSNFLSHAVHTEGVVLVPVTAHQYGKYRFVDQEGQPHEFSPAETESPSPYALGETVDVLYLPQEPKSAKLDHYWSLWGGATILGILGAVFFLMGGIFLIVLVRGASGRNAALKQTGVPVDTTFHEVKRLNISVNGQNMYRIVTTWRDPALQVVHFFTSGMLDYNPTDSFDRSKPIRVYIELNNPKKYFMDLA